MRQISLMLILVVLPVLGSGCVLKTKFDDLELQYQECTGSLEECRGKAAGLETDLQNCNAAKGDALIQIDSLIAKLEAMGEDVSRLRGERDNVADSLELAEQQLAELERKRAQEQARLATFRNMLEQLKSLMEGGLVEVKIERGRMVVKMDSAVLFDSGSTNLKSEGKDILGQVTTVLAGISDRSFQVEGHTDDQPIKTARFPSNWELSTGRSTEVVKYMIDQGMTAERISASGYGEFMPVSPNDEPEGRALNRRIEIVLLPNLEELPDLSVLEEEY